MTPPAETGFVATRAREYREDFDAAFALPPPPPPPATAAFVILRVGGERVAVRRTDLGGLVRIENTVAPVPGRSPAFVGLAGLQGGLLPVWRLATLLGGSGAGAASGGEAGWLVLADSRAGAPCAFACEGFERMVFVPESVISAPAPGDISAGRAQALVPWDGTLVPVVDLPALQAEILRRYQPPSSPPS